MKRLKELEEHGQSLLPLSHPLEFQIESLEDYEAAYRREPREPVN